MAEEMIEVLETPEKFEPGCDHTRRNSTGNLSISSCRSLKVLPRYLSATMASCHDLCKYGVKHAVEEKVRNRTFKRGTASSGEARDLVKYVILKERNKKALPDSTSMADHKHQVVIKKSAPGSAKKLDASSKSLSSPGDRTNVSANRAINLRPKPVQRIPWSLSAPGHVSGRRYSDVIGSKGVGSRRVSSVGDSINGRNSEIWTPKLKQAKDLVPRTVSLSHGPSIKRDFLRAKSRNLKKSITVSHPKNQGGGEKAATRHPLDENVLEKTLFVVEKEPENASQNCISEATTENPTQNGVTETKTENPTQNGVDSTHSSPSRSTSSNERISEGGRNRLHSSCTSSSTESKKLKHTRHATSSEYEKLRHAQNAKFSENKKLRHTKLAASSGNKKMGHTWNVISSENKKLMHTQKATFSEDKKSEGDRNGIHSSCSSPSELHTQNRSHTTRSSSSSSPFTRTKILSHTRNGSSSSLSLSTLKKNLRRTANGSSSSLSLSTNIKSLRHIRNGSSSSLSSSSFYASQSLEIDESYPSSEDSVTKTEKQRPNRKLERSDRPKLERSDRPKRAPRVRLEDKVGSNQKLKFKRGKVVDVQSKNTAPRVLRFKQIKVLGENQNSKVVDVQPKNTTPRILRFKQKTMSGEKQNGKVVDVQSKNTPPRILRFKQRSVSGENHNRKVVDVQSKNAAPRILRFKQRSVSGENQNGKVVDVQSKNTTPRILSFKQSRVLSENQNGKLGARRRSLKDLLNFHGSTTDGPVRVALRHQAVEGRKDAKSLFNNVIEETASLLVQTRKSKVKALVGAFETVISLQDTKSVATPNAS